MLHQVIQRGEIEIHLAGIFRFEFGHLQLDHHVTAQPQVVEKQIDTVVLVLYGQGILTADKGKGTRKK